MTESIVIITLGQFPSEEHSITTEKILSLAATVQLSEWGTLGRAQEQMTLCCGPWHRGGTVPSYEVFHRSKAGPWIRLRKKFEEGKPTAQLHSNGITGAMSMYFGKAHIGTNWEVWPSATVPLPFPVPICSVNIRYSQINIKGIHRSI